MIRGLIETTPIVGGVGSAHTKGTHLKCLCEIHFDLSYFCISSLISLPKSILLGNPDCYPNEITPGWIQHSWFFGGLEVPTIWPTWVEMLVRIPLRPLTTFASELSDGLASKILVGMVRQKIQCSLLFVPKMLIFLEVPYE